MDALRHTFEQQLGAALPGVEITLERPKSGELGDLATQGVSVDFV